MVGIVSYPYRWC